MAEWKFRLLGWTNKVLATPCKFEKFDAMCDARFFSQNDGSANR